MLPPGPRRPSLFQVVAYVRRPLPFLDDCARRFGKRFTMRLSGGRDFVITWDRDDAKAIFTGSPEVLSGRGNERFKTFVGENSLFVIGGEAHARHRRLLSPPFRGERMLAYGPLLAGLAREALARAPRGQPFRLHDLANEVALRAIIHAIFGVTDPERERTVTGLIASLTSRASAAMLFIPALQVNLGASSPWGRFLAARSALDAIIFDEIKRARASHDGREDVLARLVAESDLSDQELRDELLTLLGAGHETTSASVAWALRWILADDGIRTKAEEEVRAHGSSGGFDPANVPKLRYLEACINESLRLSPPVPIVPRRLEAPFRLGGFDLPEGTYVAPSPYLAQRDPEVFPEPLRFDPERFVGKRPTPFEYYPFGGGNRICIGFAFAMFELKVVIATLLASAKLRLAAPATFESKRKGIIVIPRDGTPVTIAS